MDYKEALAEALDAPRPLDALHGQPRHASALKEDVALAQRLRRDATALPRPTGDARAWASLQAELAGARTRRRAKAAPSRTWASPFVFAVRLAGVAAALLIAAGLALALNGGPEGPSTAEASVEGVVIENLNGMLTLQTADGVETIDLGSDVAVSDESSGVLTTADLQAGQVVTVQALRLGNGRLAAQRIRLRREAAVQEWCALHQDRCAAVQGALRELVARCQGTPERCAALKLRLDNAGPLAQDLRARLEEMKRRCEASPVSCRELLVFCDGHQDLCRDLRPRIEERLRQPRPPR